MNTERIRLDISSKGTVTFTKTAVVAAVRVLEQRSNITLTCTSRELIDWAYKVMWAGKKGDQFHLGIAWNNPKYTEATITFEIKYGKINYQSIPEALPLLMADLIAKTNKVVVTETPKDSNGNDSFE